MNDTISYNLEVGEDKTFKYIIPELSLSQLEKFLPYFLSKPEWVRLKVTLSDIKEESTSNIKPFIKSSEELTIELSSTFNDEKLKFELSVAGITSYSSTELFLLDKIYQNNKRYPIEFNDNWKPTKAFNCIYELLDDDNNVVTEATPAIKYFRPKRATGCTYRDVKRVFANCTALVSITIPPIPIILNSTKCFFDGCTSLIKVVMVGNSWNEVHDASYMFTNCKSLRIVILPKKWDMMYNIENMFDSCTSLETIDIPSDWGNVNKAMKLFHRCCALKKLDIPNSWDNLKYISEMFASCSELRKIVLPEDWSKVNHCANMFRYCYKLKPENIPDVSSDVYKYENMFLGCKNI